MKNNSFIQSLKEQLSPQDQLDLGLIKADHESLTTSVNQLKESLSHYQDEAHELGIDYDGSLSLDDEPTAQELSRALDIDQLHTMAEANNHHLRRSNFRYIEKQYNEIGKYTRYILANWWERIITDDELQDNPYLARQIAMSDAREEGDYEEYNRLKSTPAVAREYIKPEPTFEQCFVKIGSKLIWDVFNMPVRKLNNDLEKYPEQLIKYISGLCWIDLIKVKNKIESRINDKIKIKIVNINNKCLWTL